MLACILSRFFQMHPFPIPFVFNNLKQKNHNVYFLQDTHFTPIEENQIQTPRAIRRTLTHMHPTQEDWRYSFTTIVK